MKTQYAFKKEALAGYVNSTYCFIEALGSYLETLQYTEREELQNWYALRSYYFYAMSLVCLLLLKY